MIDSLLELDKKIFLFLNSRHTAWMDSIMLFFSSYELWWIVFCFLGLLVWFVSKKDKYLPVLFYMGTVVFSTLFTNGLKLIIQRPRPIHEQVWNGVIHNIERHSESFSFFSSHAATTFSIAVFIFFFFRSKKYIGLTAILWAFCVSYSRIYVGKHYPLDVFVGILFGSLAGYTGYVLWVRYLKNKKSAG